MVSIVTPKLWRYFKLMFTCGHVCHTHPYQWNKGLRKGKLVTLRWRLAVWCVNVGITAAYSIYLVSRAIQIHLDVESSTTKKVYIKFILFYYAFPVLFQTAILAQKENLVPFCGLIITAIRNYEEHNSNQDEEENGQAGEQETDRSSAASQRSPQKCLMPKFMDLFFDFVWFGFLGIIPFIGLLNIARPHSKEFISSLLAPDSGVFRWPVIILSAIFHIYYVFTYNANSFLFIFMGFGSMFAALISLIQVKKWLLIKSDKMPKTRVQRILDLYLSIQVTTKNFESVLCELIIPAAKGILVVLCIFCTYGAIRIEGYLAAFLAAIGTFALSILVPLLTTISMLDTVSKEILQLMKEPRFQNSLTLVQKKEVKSLHPIQLRMRRGYILDKECVKTVYQIIVESTVDMLVATA